MYERVLTPRQQKGFERTWEAICWQNMWHNDPYAENGARYNLIVPGSRLLRRSKVIGTIEFIPYDPNNPNSTVEGPRKSKFSHFEDIRENRDRVWEIDKLCLHEDYQRQGYFSQFADVFYDHAVTYAPKYYVALIERRFYRMLRIVFGLRVEQRGQPLVGMNTDLLPVVFDMEQFLPELSKICRKRSV